MTTTDEEAAQVVAVGVDHDSYLLAGNISTSVVVDGTLVVFFARDAQGVSPPWEQSLHACIADGADPEDAPILASQLCEEAHMPPSVDDGGDRTHFDPDEFVPWLLERHGISTSRRSAWAVFPLGGNDRVILRENGEARLAPGDVDFGLFLEVLYNIGVQGQLEPDPQRFAVGTFLNLNEETNTYSYGDERERYCVLKTA